MTGLRRSLWTSAVVAAGGVRKLLVGIPRYLRLLLRLMGDARVSGADKALLAGAVAYTLIPLDLIPDVIPLVGQVDDLFFLALAIDRLVLRAGPKLVLAHWDGPEDALESLCGSLDDLARRLPKPVRRKLLREVDGR